MLSLSPTRRQLTSGQTGEDVARVLIERREEFETPGDHLDWLEQVIACFEAGPNEPIREASRQMVEALANHCREERLRRNECPECQTELVPVPNNVIRLAGVALTEVNARRCPFCREVF